MKNTKFLGIAAIVAAIVFTMSACAGMTLVSLDNESITGPAQVRQYGTINTSDITVYGFYKDDSRKRVTSIRVVDFDSSRAGPQTVTVRTSAGDVSFRTEVKALTSIAVEPNAVSETLGASVADLRRRINVQGTWDGMGRERITSDWNLSGITLDNSTRPGRQTATVEYKGLRTTFTVNIYDVESIRITNNPTKVTYAQGEPLNLAGMEIATVYPAASGLPNGRIASPSVSSVSGYNPQTIGRQTLTYTFSGGKTATFTVTVTEASIDGTWTNAGGSYSFNNGTYSATATGINNNQPMMQGTYTANNGRLTFTTTHVHGGVMPSFGLPARMLTRSEMEAAMRASDNTLLKDEGVRTEMLNGWYGTTGTYTYSISGNTLYLTSTEAGSSRQTYTKR